MFDSAYFGAVMMIFRILSIRKMQFQVLYNCKAYQTCKRYTLRRIIEWQDKLLKKVKIWNI